MKDNGGEVKTQSGTEEQDARFLIAVRGRLFEVDSGYGVFESRVPYAAVGSADQEALAAMFTASSIMVDASAEDIVRYGLLAAVEFDTNIRPPFTILSLAQQGVWQGAEIYQQKPNGEYEKLS
jgi:ATP-dependent protease HslVU (ClpYQ) peptidase subunit